MELKVPPMLIKVGQRDHIKKMQENGEIFFGTFSGYRKQEKEEFEKSWKALCEGRVIGPDEYDCYRRDPHEGLKQRFLTDLTITGVGKTHKNLDIKLPAHVNIFQNLYSHLYCLYSLPFDVDSNFKIDKRMLKFGDSALVITKPLDFIQRAIHSLNKNFDMNYVNYYESRAFVNSRFPNFDKPAFNKSSFFSYQKEFRIAASLENNKVRIGNLQDISFLIDAKDMMKFEYKAD